MAVEAEKEKDKMKKKEIKKGRQKSRRVVTEHRNRKLAWRGQRNGRWHGLVDARTWTLISACLVPPARPLPAAIIPIIGPGKDSACSCRGICCLLLVTPDRLKHHSRGMGKSGVCSQPPVLPSQPLSRIVGSRTLQYQSGGSLLSKKQK